MADNAAIAASNATELPDLSHYTARGLLPAIPAEVSDAIAEHQRVVRQYRKALTTKAAAEAVIRNGSAAISTAVYNAVINGTDPGEDETRIRGDLVAARHTLDESSAAYLGFIKALNVVTGYVMSEIESWTPTALEHLAAPMAKTADHVNKTRAAFEKAQAEHAELQAIATWLNGVQLGPGAELPSPWSLVTLDLDDDLAEVGA